MGCFPLFIELEGRPCLVAGGGRVALRKVRKLLPFGPRITVVAPAACRARRIPVNVVDDPAACGFFFPALVRRGPLTGGVGTGGASPTAAAWVKSRIETALPGAEFGPILEWLAACRAPVKAALAAESARAALFADLFDRCLEKGRPLTDGEFAALLAQAKQKENAHV